MIIRVAMLLAMLVAVTAADVAWEQPKGVLVVSIEQERASYHFPFVNQAGQPITIKEVRPTCGCLTSTKTDQTEIGPGMGGSIDLEFDPGLSAGTSRKHIDVEFKRTDGSLFVESVSLECRVISPLVVRKRAVFWDREEAREDKAIEIKVEDAQAIHLLEVTCDSESYAVRLEESGEKTWRIVVSPKRLGVAKGTIMVRTDAAAPRLQKIPLYAFGL